MGEGNSTQEATFLENVVPWLEDQPFIERYGQSFFSAVFEAARLT